MGRLIAAERTPVTREQLAGALSRSHGAVFGAEPSYHRLGLAFAMVNHETANTRSMWNHNAGNIMRTPSWPGDWHELPVAQGEPTEYRSYPSLDAGAADYWRLLERRYPEALRAFDAGDPDAAAAELKARGYYQAPEHLYAAALERHQRVYFDHFPAPPNGSIDQPEPTEGAGGAGILFWIGVAVAVAAARGAYA